MTTPVAAGIDLGGTNLKGAAVDVQGSVLVKRAVPSEFSRGPRAVIDDMVRLIDELLAELTVDRSALVGVGIGSPGPLSIRRGRIIHAANLPGWKGVDVRDLSCQDIGTPVVLENDGNAAAFGEHWVGAGRGAGDLVLLTLGTGVGAGVVLDGELLHGHHENAAELGHMVIVPDGRSCPCGQRGCLEQYASARGVALRAIEAVHRGEPSELSARLEGDADVDAAEVAELAKRGDDLCARVWDDACRYLGIAIVNIQHAYNPAMVLLGGGMSQAGGFLLDRVKKHHASLQWTLHDDAPDIALASLGYDAGVIGAAGLVWKQLGG